MQGYAGSSSTVASMASSAGATAVQATASSDGSPSASLWDEIVAVYDRAQASGACSKTDTQVRHERLVINHPERDKQPSTANPRTLATGRSCVAAAGNSIHTSLSFANLCLLVSVRSLDTRWVGKMPLASTFRVCPG